ncbi:hypothetical protein [Lentzea kentuckyensis]|uniref:hypothetical protein n=1 Tax=Lentzea kentuckyensis TaxID=360086 RepID=UPI001179C8AC|nr:hypothetical protein [Lentzea kentuckyensis]
MSSDLVELEILRHDWAAMTCGCGSSAQHLQEDLLDLAGAGKATNLSEHLLPAGEVLVEVSLPALRVLLAIIASDPPGAARLECYWLVTGLVGNNVSRGEGDLMPAMRAAAREALWVFYAEVLSGRSAGMAGYAFEILYLLEEDEDRLEDLRNVADRRLPNDIHSGGYKHE